MKNNTIGARINDALLNKIRKDDRSNTTIIREALTQYYFGDTKKSDVNSTFTPVNNKKDRDKYKTIHEAVDKL